MKSGLSLVSPLQQVLALSHARASRLVCLTAGPLFFVFVFFYCGAEPCGGAVVQTVQYSHLGSVPIHLKVPRREDGPHVAKSPAKPLRLTSDCSVTSGVGMCMRCPDTLLSRVSFLCCSTVPLHFNPPSFSPEAFVGLEL